mmetsp:Transcript_40415/g.81541  ORF Transcript_40415/g.81541 Transcript_40415/m.81541 type:complete len:228 (+) Transcript_40415:620-1303(+)
MGGTTPTTAKISARTRTMFKSALHRTLKQLWRECPATLRLTGEGSIEILWLECQRQSSRCFHTTTTRFWIFSGRTMGNFWPLAPATGSSSCMTWSRTRRKAVAATEPMARQTVAAAAASATAVVQRKRRRRCTSLCGTSLSGERGARACAAWPSLRGAASSCSGARRSLEATLLAWTRALSCGACRTEHSLGSSLPHLSTCTPTGCRPHLRSPLPFAIPRPALLFSF